MKKLIAMIGAVAMSFGLFAAAFESSVNDDIQTRTLGDSNIVGSGEPDAIHWWDDNFATTGYEQPAVVSNDTTLTANTQYLKVETDSSPLLRTFTPVTTGETGGEYGKVDIENHGLFIDTKVRMTGFESDPTPQGDGNKLLVWLKAVTDEDAGGVGYTNLMVTCGFWDQGAVTPTNYVVTAAGLDVKPDEWVRLTIRADKDTTDNVAKFKVFVNEKQVTADVEGGELSVFPSLIGGANELSLAAAGFQGNGGINSVGLLTAADAPDFAADPTILTITWNEGVTGFTVGEKKIDVIGAGTTNLVIASGEIALGNIVVTPTFETNPQYELKGFTLGGETLPPDEGKAKFLMTRYNDLTLAIEAKQSRVGASLFINGDAYGDFAFVKEAVDALAKYGEYESATITLALDETAITDFGDWSVLSGDITLDLNGNTVSVDTVNEWAGTSAGGGLGCLILNSNDANITITNSVADCGQMIGSETVWLVYNTSGHMNLANANIKYDGVVYSCFDETEGYYGTMTIFGGKFKPKAMLIGEGNGLAEYLDWGTPEDGFYPVVPRAADYVAQIVGGDSFESLAEAVEAATTGNTIKMLADVDIQATGLTIPAEKTIALDLAGKTITAANTATGHIQVNGGLTVTDTAEGGQIVSGANGTYGLIQLATAKTDAAAAFTLTAGTISAYFDTLDKDGEHPSYGITVKGNGSTVTVNGGEIYAGYMAISIHGSMSQNAVVDVNGGTVRSSDDFAIYSATTATVTVDGGTVKGGTGAVMIKGGTLTVNDGTLISQKPGETGEGTDGTSGADFAVIRVNPINADATVSLQGGTFTADEGTEILAYTPVAGKTADITKGKGVEIPAPADYKWDENGKLVAKVYVAQVGDDKYETFAEALAAADVGSTLTLLADVDIAGTVANAITFDVNGHTATVAESTTLTLNAAVTLANAVPAAGGFLNEGTIEANAGLDLSAFAWGQGGLLPTTKTGVKIVIAANVTAKFAAGNNPNAMETNMPGFLSGSEDGALFVNGTDTYTYVAAETKWYIGATAEIAFAGGVTEADWVKDGSFPAVTVTPSPAGATYTGSWDAEYPAENPSEDTTFTYTVTFTGEYKGTASATFTVKKKEASFPPFIPDDPVIQGKYTTWATAFNVTDPTAAKKDAFLLNCENTDEEIVEAKKAFKFTSIVAGTTPTTSNVTAGYKDKTWNGTVVIKAYETPDCKGEPVNPSGAETKLFYQATLEIK